VQLSSTVIGAIASPRRQEILRLIWHQELAAGAIHRAMPDVTFGAVSLQLRTLAQAGLVTSRAEGQHRYYRADPEALGPVGRLLEQTWADALWRLKLLAEFERTRRGPCSAGRRRRSISRSIIRKGHTS
jgi:DNA-binding transcriptional ArsR family regulator